MVEPVSSRAARSLSCCETTGHQENVDFALTSLEEMDAVLSGRTAPPDAGPV